MVEVGSVHCLILGPSQNGTSGQEVREGKFRGFNPLCILRFLIIYMEVLEPGHRVSHTL